MMEQQGYEQLPSSQESFMDLWETVAAPLFATIESNPHTDDLHGSWNPEEQVDMNLINSQVLANNFDENVFDLPVERPVQDVVTPPASTVPVTTDHPGEYEFQLRFQKSGTAKSVTSTYSELLKKLYCQPAKTSPVEVLVSKEPPAGAIIRATAVYKKSEHVAEVVRRCPHHQNEDAAEQRSHLIRLEGSQRALYFEDPHTKRHSVTVPYEPPQLGSEMTTILLSFMCNSSCAGGMNRRPIITILTLEAPEGVVLGRRCLEVRVCACPGRDRITDERQSTSTQSGKRTKKRKSAPAPDLTSVRKLKMTSSAEEDDKEMFVLPVRGRKRYEMLKEINDGLELLDKESKMKTMVVKQEAPSPSSGKRLMQRGERSDSD